jgi:hypothetical protein
MQAQIIRHFPLCGSIILRRFVPLLIPPTPVSVYIPGEYLTKSRSVVHQTISTAYPVVTFMDPIKKAEEGLSAGVVLKKGLLFITREVTWQTAPECCIRRGRATRNF